MNVQEDSTLYISQITYWDPRVLWMKKRSKNNTAYSKNIKLKLIRKNTKTRRETNQDRNSTSLWHNVQTKGNFRRTPNRFLHSEWSQRSLRWKNWFSIPFLHFPEGTKNYPTKTKTPKALHLQNFVRKFLRIASRDLFSAPEISGDAMSEEWVQIHMWKDLLYPSKRTPIIRNLRTAPSWCWWPICIKLLI